MNVDQSVRATPMAAADDAVYAAVKARADEQAQISGEEAQAGRHNLALSTTAKRHAMGLETKEELAGTRMETQSRIHEGDIAFRGQETDKEIGLQDIQLGKAESMGNRSMIFAGIKSTLQLTGAWWQSDQTKGVVDMYTKQKGFFDDIMSYVREKTDEFIGNYGERAETQKKSYKKSQDADYGPELLST